MTFYRMNDKGNEEWGFDSVRKKNMRGQAGIPVEVPIIRFSSWIKKEIEGRKLPDYTPPDVGAGPRVVMKLDVEGMEMSVLPDLLFSGVFCNSFDYVFGESHYQWGFYPMTLRNNVTLLNGRESKLYLDSFHTAIRINPHCKTRFHEHDDESYLHDGMPLPANKTKAFDQVSATMA